MRGSSSRQQHGAAQHTCELGVRHLCGALAGRLDQASKDGVAQDLSGAMREGARTR